MQGGNTLNNRTQQRSLACAEGIVEQTNDALRARDAAAISLSEATSEVAVARKNVVHALAAGELDPIHTRQQTIDALDAYDRAVQAYSDALRQNEESLRTAVIPTTQCLRDVR